MYDSPSTSSEMPEVDTDQPVAKDDSHYPMDHPRRGIAAIFNFNTFDGRASERRGSEVDVQNLTRSFAKLGFEVELFIDRTLAELQCILEELSSRDHCDADCFVLVFMSHGGEGQLWARDRRFDINILWDPFMADYCPSLKNKPKVFIIQACQGDSYLGAVRVGLQFSEEAGQSGQAADVTKLVPTYLMPVCADFLIALSTIPDDSPSTSSEMPEDDTEQHVAKDDSHYPMDHPRRGIAAMFNFNTFDNRPSGRLGSELDVQNLTRSFAKLGFEVELFIDRTLADIQSILEDLSSRDHCDADCFVLVFMSHGVEGQLWARDRRFDINILWDPFTADNCPSLKNKPKIFIIQACQGDSYLGAVRVGLQFSEEAHQSGQAADVTKLVPTYLMPVCADFLIALSTIPGHVSYRDPQGKGSWYIQSLCCHLDSHGFKEDLLTLLTHVGREVALDRTYISRIYRIQLPLIISALIRVLKFTKKDQAKNCVKRRNTCSDDSDCNENKDEKSRLPLETAIHQSIAGLEEEGDTQTSAPSSKRTKK